MKIKWERQNVSCLFAKIELLKGGDRIHVLNIEGSREMFGK